MNDKTSEILESRTAKMWQDDEGIVWYEIFPGAHETMEDINTNLDYQVQLSGGDPAPILYDMRQMVGIDQDALIAYYHDPRAVQTTKAMATVQSSWMRKTISNLVGFRFFAKAVYPARSFNDLDKALEWLRSYL